jgi:S-adenosylmethionine decarboxylase
MENSPLHFGEHLTIDGYGGDHDLLNNKNLVTRCLTELPKKLGMNILKEPEVVFAPSISEKDPGGWSGFVIISESHISIHTFPARQFVSIDVYSCKNGMELEIVKNYFKEAFMLEELETNFIIRGKNYPQNNI